MKIENLKPNADCILVGFDVTSLFTNMDFSELLTAFENIYSTFNKSEFEIPCPPTEDILWILQTILENDVSEFNKAIYKQVIECSMGYKMSPEAIDLYVTVSESDSLRWRKNFQNIL